MSIVSTYEVIERMIVLEMADILRYDGEESYDEWADDRRRKFAELNTFVIATLQYNNPNLVDGVLDAVNQAQDLITEHLRNEWQIEDIERRTNEYAQKAIDYLNNNIQKSLISTETQVGTVEESYNRVIDSVAEQEPKDVSVLKTAVTGAVLAEVGQGLYAGYKQIDGQQWRLDRYVNEVEKHMYTDVYEDITPKALTENGVELVKVHSFANPRDACVELQASGTICIVPRNEAAEENLKYPNIHDAKHRYLQYGGHHGADGNCRHAWHNIDSKVDRSKKLFSVLDVMLLNLLLKRTRLSEAVENKLGGDA